MLLKKNIVIHKPVAHIFNYLLDFSNIYEWDPNVIEGHRCDLGNITIGSKFRITFSLAGIKQDLEYTLESLSTNKHLELRCKTQQFSVLDRIELEALDENHTRVYYTAELALGSRIKDTLFRPIMNRISKRVMLRLKEALENSPSPEPKKANFPSLNIPINFSTKGWNLHRKHFTATITRPKTIAITGPTSGLGKAAATSLAGKGCNLIFIGRNPKKMSALTRDFKARGFPGELVTYTCDMEKLDSVRTACNQIIADGHNIDVLINNAGALYSKPHPIIGVERTTVVDLIAPWTLSCLLLPVIKTGGCIINVTSGGMYAAKLNIEKLIEPSTPFSGSRAYALAKRGLDTFSAGLNQELVGKDIRVHSMHPGWADTPGVLTSLPSFHKVTKRFLRTPLQGADTIIWLAMENPKQGGQFWLDRKMQARHIFQGTNKKSATYEELRRFLTPYATPKITATMD